MDDSEPEVVGGVEAWISPMYCRINVPGFRSLVAKSPDCPSAGWVGAVMGVIFTSEEEPVGMVAGMEIASLDFARSEILASGGSVGEYAGAFKYGSPKGQFLGSADGGMALMTNFKRACNLPWRLASAIVT